MHPRLAETLRDLAIEPYIKQAEDAALARLIAAGPNGYYTQTNPERLPRLGFLFETQALSAYEAFIRRSEGSLEETRTLFSRAFACWRSIISLPTDTGIPTGREVSPVGIQLVRSEMPTEPLLPELTLALHVAATGLLAARTTETRLELNQFSVLPIQEPSTWREQVAGEIARAFILLVRKANGWEDIDQALSAITRLRQLQADFEDHYLDGQGDQLDQTLAAVELVGLYHLAQLLTLVGEYLRDGTGAIGQLSVRLDRHHERAITAFTTCRNAILTHIAEILWAGCRELAQNAIWTHISGLGEAAVRFGRILASRGRPQPVLELWPSQQKALQRNLLDPYRRAILVEMPTSAGKTLLAEFAIVQAKALNPQGTVAYIVPTRALVNQVTAALRADFREISLIVEQAVPAFELDPTEDRLLQSAPDVLVTTPEKLDLLIRRDHPATRPLVLVIADEAHNIRDEGRGARLELLLGMIKRDRPGARFLLLSPFLPNDTELVTWLGEERALPPISVDWKPGRRVVGAVTIAGRGRRRGLVLETLAAADNTDVKEGMRISLGPAPASRTISGLTCATVASMLKRGSILVLCRGQGTAVSRALEIKNVLPRLDSSPKLDAICHYLVAEVGRPSNLIECLNHGVAYHHAGLSPEARWLIESLIRSGHVKVVCGTTTLAQGVNFPITTVIVETLKKGDRDLSYQDFWNIAGRAGRALNDAVGVVAFPTENEEKRYQYETFLRGEAEEISSQLTGLLARAEEIAERFDLQTLRRWPELSALLQFLAHAMRVAGQRNIAVEVDELLRASLVYHQAQRQGEQIAQQLILICRSYLSQISQTQEGVLTLADQTGFATPSVLSLLAQTRQNPELALPERWEPDRLFGGELTPLTQRVQAIADLPEMRLGQGTRPPFNPERVAAILRDWVTGKSLDEMATNYSLPQVDDPDTRVTQFSSYLFAELLGRASWGIGALESVCLAGSDEEVWQEVGYIPSMIFFGVRKKEAVWLRMAGVPRVVANGLGDLWMQRVAREPESFEQVRNWVSQLSDSDWQAAIPPRVPITPQEMRFLWREFTS